MLAASCVQLRVGFAVNIGAADQDDGALALQPRPQWAQCGRHGSTRRRLHGQLAFFLQDHQAGQDLIIGNSDHVIDKFTNNRQPVGQGKWRAQTVGNGVDLVQGDWFAGSQAS